MYRYDRIHRPETDAHAINESHIKQYQEQGFLAVEGVFDPSEVAEAESGLLHLIGGGRPDFKGIEFERGIDVTGLSIQEREQYVRKLMEFIPYDHRLAAVSRHASIMSIVQRLVGTEVRVIQDMALLKPPRVGRDKPWHQDTAYFRVQPLDLVIGVWIALDPALPENGCMHVIPGSHLAGPQPHYHTYSCQLPDDAVDVERDVVVPLQPGGVLFFSGLLHHGTPPNTSTLRRRALQFHYASVLCHDATAEEYRAQFKDSKGYAGCSEWDEGALKRPMSDRPSHGLPA